MLDLWFLFLTMIRYYRLDRTVKAADEKIKEAIPVNPESLRNPLELDNLLSTSSPIKVGYHL